MVLTFTKKYRTLLYLLVNFIPYLQDVDQTCYPRRLAVCRTMPQKITLTERKQRCNGEKEYRTTKMCTTREDGSGGYVLHGNCYKKK